MVKLGWANEEKLTKSDVPKANIKEYDEQQVKVIGANSDSSVKV
jgi:hypothetical protein